MKRYLSILLVFGVCGVSCSQEGTVAVSGGSMTFGGSCDSSAAVAITDRLMLVADDENNVLRLFDVIEQGPAVQRFELDEFLRIAADHPEADIEGATKVGSRIYWITSHGRNKDGKERPNRYRFFATDFEVKDGKVTLRKVGKPCRSLAEQLADSPMGRALGIAEATMLNRDLSKGQRERLAPKEEGLNIEALAASADGRTLYIGLRNPLMPLGSGKRAIVIPLKNARDVVERSADCDFGRAMMWNLTARGVRAMEYSPRHRSFFLVAGPIDEETDFALYRWSGDESETPSLVRPIKSGLKDFKPEALVPFENSDSLVLVGDDGTIMVKVAGPHEVIDEEEFDRRTSSCQQKYLLDSRRKTFRAIKITP